MLKLYPRASTEGVIYYSIGRLMPPRPAKGEACFHFPRNALRPPDPSEAEGVGAGKEANSPKFSLFGPRSLGRAVHAVAEGPGLSKAEFMEKVRRSNEACQLGDFQTAVKLYGEALRADPQNCILYSNRSAAHLKLGQYQTALDDAVKARLLNPKWPKVGGRDVVMWLVC
ncbi:hypothetical protein AOLI_G00228520 [Acnodon oligacanthus]